MNVPSTRVPSARPRPARVVVLVAAALSLVALLLLCSAARAAAEDEDDGQITAIVAATDESDPADEQLEVQLAAEPTSTPGLIFVAATSTVEEEQPDDQELAEPPEAPAGEGAELVEVAATQPAVATASLEVHRRMCDTFVDEIAGDIDALDAACPEPYSDEVGIVPVMLLNIDGVTTPETGGAAQVYEWADLPLGTYYLGAETRDGFSDQPVVHCRVDAGNDPWVRYPVAHHGITLDVSVPDAPVLCVWYEVPAPVHVTVNAWLCPPGVAPDEVQLWVLSQECETRLDGATFALDTGEAVEERETVGGEVAWDGLAPGPVLVDSPVQPGHGEPVVYCHPDNDQLQAAGNPLTVVDGAFDLDLSTFDGAGALCTWYSIPRPGLISVTTWLCPPGDDLANPATDCVTPYDGVQFEFGDGLGLWPMAVTGEDGPGAFFYSGLEPGTYTIAEDVPPGIVDHYVYCLTSVPSDNPMLGPALGVVEPPVVAGSIELDLAENETIACDWYNVPAADDGGSDGGPEEETEDEDGEDGGEQSGGDRSGSDGAVDIQTLPNTGAAPPAADRVSETDRWLGFALFLTLSTIGCLGVRQRRRSAPAPAAARTYRRP